MNTKTFDITYINKLALSESVEDFYRCSGSNVWANSFKQGAPFTDDTDVIQKAKRAWSSLTEKQWLEAFQIHPRIGDIESLRQKYASTAGWASHEQAGAAAASDKVLSSLSATNDDYYDKFGYTFIICATGKSAEEMLLVMKERLLNEPAVEFEKACEEQMKITQIRLEKLRP